MGIMFLPVTWALISTKLTGSSLYFGQPPATDSYGQDIRWYEFVSEGGVSVGAEP